ncbi:MAG: hypothetical protein JNM52_02805 [Betaproteobacteria bacterium]|nr:hypothetical protein [Betaproteobacteria bacterium]
MPRFIPILLVALLTWLTAASAQTSTRAPLLAPANECRADFFVDGEQVIGTTVGKFVTFKVTCVALKSQAPECLAGAKPIHGVNDCHLDGGSATSYQWRDRYAKVFEGITDDYLTQQATEVGDLRVSFRSLRLNHGISPWIAASIPVGAAPPTPPDKTPITPPATCELPNPRFESRIQTCPSGMGRWEQEREYICPGAYWTEWYDTFNTCTVPAGPCVPPNPLELTNFKNCWNNTQVLQRRSFNNADNVCAYTDWDTDCPPQPACNQPNPLVLTQVVDCVAPKTGKMTQTRVYDNTPGFCGYGAWVDGACSQTACVKPMPEELTQTIDCAKNTGSQLQTRTILETAPGPGACPYSEWANSGGCTCPGKQTFNTTFGSCSCQPPLLEDVACPAPRNVGTARKVTSYTGAACTASVFLNVDQCSCPGPVTSEVACTGGQTGTIKTVTSFSGGACVSSEEITNTCACSGGRTFNGSACVCAAGYTWDGSTCVKDKVCTVTYIWTCNPPRDATGRPTLICDAPSVGFTTYDCPTPTSCPGGSSLPSPPSDLVDQCFPGACKRTPSRLRTDCN